MLDIESVIDAIEQEHLKRNFFSQKFKIVTNYGILGFNARIIVSESKKETEQLGFEINEGNYLNNTPAEYYDFMISEWKRLIGEKRVDFFQAEWERVNA